MRDGSAVRSLLTRGVWRAAYLVDGFPVLHAITRRGYCIKRVVLREEVDEVRAIAWLEQLLDREDPEPSLRLVKTEPAARGMSVAAFLALCRR